MNEQKLTVLEAEIEDKNAEIAKLKERIVGLEGASEMYRNAMDASFALLRRIMGQLAIQTIVPNTHFERNEQQRQIVRGIKSHLETDVQRWLDYKGLSRDMEDIPF